jgi:hypothetical protein
MLSAEDTLAMLEAMRDDAVKESEEHEHAGRDDEAYYWEGWADGLDTLSKHMKTNVKVTCFPTGNCKCHPVKFVRR